MSFDYSSIYANMNTPGATYPYGEAINETAPGSLDGTPLERRWLNDLLGMWQRILTLSAITPNATAENATEGNSQYVQGLAAMFLPKTVTHEDNGSAVNAYVIKRKGSTPEIADPQDGQIFVFDLPGGIVNTGGSTLQVDGGATIAFVDQTGSAFTGGEVISGRNKVVYNDALSQYRLQQFEETVHLGQINGLEISNSAGDVANDIDVAPGQCADITGRISMVTTSSFTKEIDNNWAEGTGNGGFPSTEPLNVDEWYRYFGIVKADGQVDFGYDVAGNDNASSLLTDATDYISYRQIAWVYYESPGNIRLFFQDGDRFFWQEIWQKSPSISPPATIQTNESVLAPPETIAEISARADGGAGTFYWVGSSDQVFPVPSVSSKNLESNISFDGSLTTYAKLSSNSEFSYRASQASGVLEITVSSWLYNRGRN